VNDVYFVQSIGLLSRIRSCWSWWRNILLLFILLLSRSCQNETTYLK